MIQLQYVCINGGNEMKRCKVRCVEVKWRHLKINSSVLRMKFMGFSSSPSNELTT
jgi:hypothetical protein